MIINADELIKLIKSYAKKYPPAVYKGSEYIYLNNEAITDAVHLVCDIFDKAVFPEEPYNRLTNEQTDKFIKDFKSIKTLLDKK